MRLIYVYTSENIKGTIYTKHNRYATFIYEIHNRTKKQLLIVSIMYKCVKYLVQLKYKSCLFVFMWSIWGLKLGKIMVSSYIFTVLFTWSFHCHTRYNALLMLIHLFIHIFIYLSDSAVTGLSPFNLMPW